MESDTPRTDALVSEGGMRDDADFARQLERELDAAIKERNGLRDDRIALIAECDCLRSERQIHWRRTKELTAELAAANRRIEELEAQNPSDCEMTALECKVRCKALSAERDELKGMHAHLGHSYTMLAKECDALKKRVEELESHPPADRELRKDLICAALTGLCANPMHHTQPSNVLSDSALMVADAALAAMRKGEGAC